MQKPIRVRLMVDLTKYASGLIPGVEGYASGKHGMWSRGSDRFTGVNFPGITTLDVLWESLEIIDEEYLKEAEERQHNFIIDLKSATNVVLAVGPRGGFRYLSYSYRDKDGLQVHTSVGFKKEAEHLLQIFESYEIPVEKRIL